MATTNTAPATKNGGTPKAEPTRGIEKSLVGKVTSNKMTKSIVVSIMSYKKHPAYGKYVRRTKKYMAHDENQQSQIGDTVRIVECRPLSKNKRWRLQSVVEKAV